MLRSPSLLEANQKNRAKTNSGGGESPGLICQDTLIDMRVYLHTLANEHDVISHEVND